MGGLMGGSKSKSSSESYNKNNALVTGAMSPAMGYLTQGGNAMQALLGGDTSGLETYKNNMGYNWELQQGTDSLLSKMANIGGLDSGATLKGLAKFQTGLNNQYANNYMQNLLGFSELGGKAGELIANVGNYNKSKSSSSQSAGIGGVLGGLASNAAIFSDRRLKQDIVKIGEHEDGLGVYNYSYLWSPEKTETGVMADEVEVLRPWALGPEVKGYKTVNYGRL